MSAILDPIGFPLHGARLIEASAGTGKTWTIAALYLRLVLGHGGEAAFARPLLPPEILVMTFTRAATRELSDRIRARLLQAARCFQGQDGPDPDADPFLAQLLDAYPDGVSRQQAAYRLALAADAMDDCAVLTIDAWCQGMLREHAFDSGSLFDEELVPDTSILLHNAVRDYWRSQVYGLDQEALPYVFECWPQFSAFEKSMRELAGKAERLPEEEECSLEQGLGHVLATRLATQLATLAPLKQEWSARAERMEQWFQAHRSALSGAKLRDKMVAGFFHDLRAWCDDPGQIQPGPGFWKGAEKLRPEQLRAACNKGKTVEPGEDYEQLDALLAAFQALEPIRDILLRHAAREVAQRMRQAKQEARQFDFDDQLARLKHALEGPQGTALRQRIVRQFPVAMIDEFQDTSPDQYRILDLLYRVGAAPQEPQESEADAGEATGLFLIGDPKQAIYSFRGADINSYLAARRATHGRHYRLDTNYRSTQPLVAALNHFYSHAENTHARGAFGFRTAQEDPVPFVPVAARGRAETLVDGQGTVAALSLCVSAESDWTQDDLRPHFAGLCAERIAGLLNDPQAGFRQGAEFLPLLPADIAILVRDRVEARAVRAALQERGLASVYLSDQDSVLASTEATDVLRWLRAVAAPLDGAKGRAALASGSARLTLEQLLALAQDELAWDAWVERFKSLRQTWQRLGVLAMLHSLIHQLDLPARLLRMSGGERALTNLLHLAELLQAASQQVDGEHALIRWLAEQIDAPGVAGDELLLRLESDTGLIKVVTIHKAKGLEFPLVFVPFASRARVLSRKNTHYGEYVDEHGRARIELTLSDARLQDMDGLRLEEELRLLYVALTRPRHALWLGLASAKDSAGASALGYLLNGAAPLAAAELLALVESIFADRAEVRLEQGDVAPGCSRWTRVLPQEPLRPAPAALPGVIERRWGIASYTSITHDLGAAPPPETAREEKLAQDDDDLPLASEFQDAPWHRFPRGASAGQFLHEQLEWLAGEGFASVAGAQFASRLAERSARAGWGRHEALRAWLQAMVQTRLPALGAALEDLDQLVAEAEFWLPTAGLDTDALDRWCRQHVLDGAARAPLAPRRLHGMLRGFKDLVCEHGGRYWVIDYKSNQLGPGDQDYHPEALVGAMTRHRYDVQGVIYLLALHRQLRDRLGPDYDPERHLGGAIFYFVRGVGNPDTRGCLALRLDRGALEQLDAMLPAGASDSASGWEP